jgi:hypothetical protein
MNWQKPMLAFGLVIGLASPLLFPAPAFAQKSGEATGVQGSKNIRTLKEIRDEGVVRQRWDVSCGAAALSTVLTDDFKDPTPETAIVVWILHRVDAGRVRSRGGFSLLDLKHFAEARGYHAEGFGYYTDQIEGAGSLCCRQGHCRGACGPGRSGLREHDDARGPVSDFMEERYCVCRSSAR